MVEHLFITQSELMSRSDHGEAALSLPGKGGDTPCDVGRRFAGRQSCFLFRLLEEQVHQNERYLCCLVLAATTTRNTSRCSPQAGFGVDAPMSLVDAGEVVRLDRRGIACRERHGMPLPRI